MTRGRLNSLHGIEASQQGRNGPVAAMMRPEAGRAARIGRQGFARSVSPNSSGAPSAITGGAARIAGALGDGRRTRGSSEQIRFIVGGVMPPFCLRDRLAGDGATAAACA